MTEKRKHFWEVVGKISLLITTIATVIGIYTRFFPTTAKLVGFGQYNLFALSPDLTKVLSEVKLKENETSLRETIEKESKIRKQRIGFNNYDISGILAKELENAWTEKFKYRFDLYKCQIYLTIINKGNKLAENVVLDLPVKGVALIREKDDSQRIVDFTKIIEIGNIRSKYVTRIVIWTDKEIGSYDEKEFLLTYKDGVSQISFGKYVYGFQRTLSNLTENFFILACIVFILIWSVFETTFYFMRKKYCRISETND